MLRLTVRFCRHSFYGKLFALSFTGKISGPNSFHGFKKRDLFLYQPSLIFRWSEKQAFWADLQKTVYGLFYVSIYSIKSPVTQPTVGNGILIN